MAKNPTFAFGPKTANQNKNIRIARLSLRSYPSEIGGRSPEYCPNPNADSKQRDRK